MVISTDDKTIRYLSQVYVGRTHDYTLLKHELPPDKEWFIGLNVKIDLGYQGFATGYSCKKVIIPHKKPKNGELTLQQKDENTQKAKERIPVEHTIGGMKKYSFLSNRLRAKDFDMYNKVLGICAGLWNFSIK